MLSFNVVLTSILGALAASSVATPVSPLEKRDVYAPPVLYPHSGTVWYSGQRHNVTWDNSNPPKQISNGAFILLREGSSTLPIILAYNFDLRAGRVEVTVPDLLTRSDYNILLFGDSGNWGEEFTIVGPLDV